MVQRQQQAGLINHPIQPGAGRVDDVPPQGVSAVNNCRLPAFWRTRPELWFFQIESQFQVHNVTSDSTRYHLVVAALDVEAIVEVLDIIRRPPAVEKYRTLKTALISWMTDSPEVQLHKLLTGVELGDRRPSQLLRHMRTLTVPANVSDDVLRSRWLDLLPPPTRRLLLVIRNQSLEDLAVVADEAHEVGSSVMATSHSPRRSQWPSNQVAQELAELRRAIEQLTTITRESIGSSSGQRGRSRSRGTRSARMRSPTPANNARTGYCWYHVTHGDVADNSKISEAPAKSRYQRMAEEFASTEVPAGEMACIPDLPVQHHIVTIGQHVFTRPRRLAGERLEAAKSEFANLLERKIIRSSSSQRQQSLRRLLSRGHLQKLRHFQQEPGHDVSHFHYPRKVRGPLGGEWLWRLQHRKTRHVALGAAWVSLQAATIGSGASCTRRSAEGERS
ncbi:unnamed protein product [Trichogramma brassicae]|uniref:DUF7041 domain-containing protein n=1 Tax=Trichogramma brassicae TaxID=86971 RepID=A0A6H5ILY7_9HYME|nr:unnamed protein product [Trichogramma brassicae]